jgi:hypothetical protein
LLLPILLACIAILVAYSFLPKIGAGPDSDGQGGEISLHLSGWPLVEGNNATLRAFSTCGPFGVSLDGAGLGSGEAAFSAQFPLEAGGHAFTASGSGCNSTLAFIVQPRECSGNATEGCSRGGCAGSRQCTNGVFSDCELRRKICVPGERMGCSTDACAFGYATCNPCGTGFGGCLPDEKKDNASCDGTRCN